MGFDNDLCRQCNEIFPADWRGNGSPPINKFEVAYFVSESPYSISRNFALNQLFVNMQQQHTLEEAVHALIALEAAWAMGVRS